MKGQGTAVFTAGLSRERLGHFADGLAVAVAIALPWSTSAISIMVPIWLVVLASTLDFARLSRVLRTPAGGLPVLLWAVTIVGMAWSDASWADKVEAVRGVHRLLLIPLLLVQFNHSEAGARVMAGFLASCTALLVVSWGLMLLPNPTSWMGRFPGIPVKDYLVQSGEFLLCAYGLSHWGLDEWRAGRRGRALALAGLAVGFMSNIAFVATGRSTLLVAAVLVIIFGLQRFGWRGRLGLIGASALLAIGVWHSSAYLRQRVLAVPVEVSRYVDNNAETSSGLRLEWWTKSLDLVASAPLVGHGTGSIPRLLGGEPGDSAWITGNPHNVTLEIAIQLGLLGVVVLYAMWAAHLLLFRGSGLAAWIGFGLVVQDIIGSLFLSHLLDFSTGWVYVLGVGIVGGTVLRERRALERPQPT
jgi:O-antigen ligase